MTDDLVQRLQIMQRNLDDAAAAGRKMAAELFARERELAQAKADADRFRALPALLAPGGLAINKWLVQVRPQEDNYQSVYFADPPSGTPVFKAGSPLTALRIAVDRALSAAEEQTPWPTR